MSDLHIKNEQTTTWLAVYLYHTAPWQMFLTTAVQPLIQSIFERQLVEQFFFIRYWERGPHLRLRCKGRRDTLEQVLKPEFEHYFTGYFQENPSPATKAYRNNQWQPNDTFQFALYEPEITRYGGPVGIQIAEKQFAMSSEVVLALMNVPEPWHYERALGAAIQLHLTFAWALGMSLVEVKQFYGFIFGCWFNRAYDLTSTLSETEAQERQTRTLVAFAQQFEQQQEYLVTHHQLLWQALEDEVRFEQAWLNQWRDNMKCIKTQLNQALQADALHINTPHLPGLSASIAWHKLWPVLESYVHMTNNRLGIMNRDEAYLGYLIVKSLEGATPI